MKLFYSVNCGKDCNYYSEDHRKEIWKDAKHYDKELCGYKVSNFGGITTTDDKKVDRSLNNNNEICVNINGDEIVLYIIVASTFLPEPDGGYLDIGTKISVHHRDNNSYNFNPDNMKFLTKENHFKEPHLTLQNIIEWDKKIDEICKKIILVYRSMID